MTGFSAGRPEESHQPSKQGFGIGCITLPYLHDFPSAAPQLRDVATVPLHIS